MGAGGEARGPGELRPGAEQKAAAATDVFRDVAKVQRRKDAAVLEAVEDDEVEFADLDLKQLANREGDQGELVQGSEVVALGRAEDGEVDEVDGRVGFQEAPPGAFALMGLPGDKEDPEAVADAVDGDHGTIIDRRDSRRGAASACEFHDDGAGPGDRDLDRGLLPDRDIDGVRRLAIAADGEAGGTGWGEGRRGRRRRGGW